MTRSELSASGRTPSTSRDSAIGGTSTGTSGRRSSLP